MDFRIADTFTTSLAKLTGDEQKAVKTTAFDLQLSPANPGMSFHKLDRAKDPRFWSVRASRNIRLIVHKTDRSLLLCYVGHHDNAYQWAERRKLETHPRTGAAQWVEVREMVREITVPLYVAQDNVQVDAQLRQSPAQKPLLFVDTSDDELLGYGVPVEWLDDVRKADEDSVLDLADHLPGEAAEALLELATGGTPQIVQPVTANADPFEHPDAQRRFRTMKNLRELELALEYPWEKWTIFLHPAQRQWVEKDYNGPARVSGSAGTGKTIVALHRAVFLARKHPAARVLLTTFSNTLANSLQTRLRRLISSEPQLGERLEVQAINTIGRRLYESHCITDKNSFNIASTEVIQSILKEVSEKAGNSKFSQLFLLAEWTDVVDAWQLDTWKAYRDVRRLGRKTRLPEQQRALLWSIFDGVRTQLMHLKLITFSGLFRQLCVKVSERKHTPFDYVVVDEAQDISVSQLRFLAALGGQRPNSLFFVGDPGQRIFQLPFSWQSLGIDIRGRSRTLHINYRTSHQIRMQADRLLGPKVSDVDGNTAERRGTVSVFNGATPDINILDSVEDESKAVSEWLSKRGSEGVLAHEMGVFVRSDKELDRARNAVGDVELPFKVLDENLETTAGYVSIGTMHLAKGLEFRAVVVMACDDEVIPLQERIETVVEDSDLAEVYNTERHLLYVACTRARDYLLVTSVDPASEFLDDLRM